MNLARPSLVISYVFRIWLALRRLLPRRKCRTFGVREAEKVLGIEKIYVINLDRESGRWFKMEQELMHILDSSGTDLLSLTERHVAVDAKAYSQEPPKDAEIDPFFTLGDQLFVEPQPLAFPTRLELNTPIRMSRAEIAVARSHINVWRKVAAGNDAFVLILEDDVWFHSGFTRYLDQAWDEVVSESDKGGPDILYVSYLEVKHGAPKTFFSKNVFQPKRGLWHLSGYVLSRRGAQTLLRLLPCRGPVDLWINHQFEMLDVRATRRSLISQRCDAKSTNAYSILPTLTAIGAISSEGASLFKIRPTEQPVFGFGLNGSGQSSLAMALSMLGYRCCSDFQALPAPEMERLLQGSGDRVFDAYVNVGSLDANVIELRSRYPKAKFILTEATGIPADETFLSVKADLNGADVAVLYSEELNRWQIVCEHLRCAPPTCSFPTLKDIGQRAILDRTYGADQKPKCKWPRRDKSPWVVDSREWWEGIRSVPTEKEQKGTGTFVKTGLCLEYLDKKRWLLRTDTFTDNLALFRPSNVEFISGSEAALSVTREPLGVRDYAAASICSRDQYLFGKFSATIQASNAPGIVTGFFLHRNSPRQEIDIEITGDRTNRLLVNVFYNPGGEGANFDYGYRGAPSDIELGFDASKGSHRFAIEWSPCEIRWLVDDRLVHKRLVWDPTPIPHLPMALHVNIWPSRSTQLAGRVNNRRLPATTMVRSIAIEADSVVSTVES